MSFPARTLRLIAQCARVAFRNPSSYTYARTALVAAVQARAPVVTPSHARSSRLAFHTSASVRAAKAEGVVGPDGLLPFYLADIGEGIAEAEVLKWYIKVGDNIKQFDKVAEVQSDKATVDISSRYDGVVEKLCYEKGEFARVGQPLIFLRVAGSPAAAPSASATAAPAAATATAAPASPNAAAAAVAAATTNAAAVESSFDRVLTTPAVRRIAREHGINLTQVAGSGREGRVMKEDVLSFIATGGKPAAAAVAAPAAIEAPVQAAAPAVAAYVAQPTDRVEPIRGYRRAMVKSMNASLTIPHFGFKDEIVLDRAVALRQALKSTAEKQGISFTLMPILIKAASLAMLRYPIINSSLNADGTSITYKGSHNIGIAIDTPSGLVVPNIKNVQNLSLMEVAAALNELQAAALAGKLSAAQLTGGTFSLSNVGVIGGTYTQPVIVPPEVCIGAIGRMRKEPRFDAQERVVAMRIAYISWSADHRVIDGATMAHFGNAWKQFVEAPEMMLAYTK